MLKVALKKKTTQSPARNRTNSNQKQMQIRFFLPNKNAQKPSPAFNILKIVGEVGLQFHKSWFIVSCLLFWVPIFLLLLLINILKKLTVIVVLYRRDTNVFWVFSQLQSTFSCGNQYFTQSFLLSPHVHSHVAI